MAKYHINPKTGNPGVCRAVNSCPFGDLNSDHYPSAEAARSAYETYQYSLTEEGLRQVETLEDAQWLQRQIFRQRSLLKEEQDKYRDELLKAAALSPLWTDDKVDLRRKFFDTTSQIRDLDLVVDQLAPKIEVLARQSRAERKTQMEAPAQVDHQAEYYRLNRETLFQQPGPDDPAQHPYGVIWEEPTVEGLTQMAKAWEINPGELYFTGYEAGGVQVFIDRERNPVELNFDRPRRVVGRNSAIQWHDGSLADYQALVEKHGLDSKNVFLSGYESGGIDLFY